MLKWISYCPHDARAFKLMSSLDNFVPWYILIHVCQMLSQRLSRIPAAKFYIKRERNDYVRWTKSLFRKKHSHNVINGMRKNNPTCFCA